MDANSRNCSSNQQHDRTHRTQETPTPATGQAPLHDPGGPETPPARGAEGSAPDPLPRIKPEDRSDPSEESGSGTESISSTLCECGHFLWDHGRPAGCFPNGINCDCLRFQPLRPVELHTRRRR